MRGKCFSATDPATETVRAGRSGDPVNTGVSTHKLNKFQVVRGRECELPEKSRSRQLEESATLGKMGKITTRKMHEVPRGVEV